MDGIDPARRHCITNQIGLNWFLAKVKDDLNKRLGRLNQREKDQGEYTIEFVLHGAEHRESGSQWLCTIVEKKTHRFFALALPSNFMQMIKTILCKPIFGETEGKIKQLCGKFYSYESIESSCGEADFFTTSMVSKRLL